jgi:SAM-dependent methyltransferase
MRDHAGRVRRYYNRNTFWMRLFGQGRGEGVIHRPVWTGQERSRGEALHTVERLIGETLLPAGAPEGQSKRFLDLGCGIGGSALWLAARYPVSITGITLSPVQAQIAGNLSSGRGMEDRCRFQVADFTRLPELSGTTDAYAIESFSHGDDPRAFFDQIGRLLPAGGRLILCDDFVTTGAKAQSMGKEKWLSRFREGWHLKSLITADEVLMLASSTGFDLIRKMDLTPWLRRTPVFALTLQQLAGRVLRRSPWGASIYGGSALQICQQNGWTEYLFLVLEKR